MTPSTSAEVMYEKLVNSSPGTTEGFILQSAINCALDLILKVINIVVSAPGASENSRKMTKNENLNSY